VAPRGKARPEGSSLIGSIVDRINYLRQEKLSGLDVAATKFVVGDTRHYGKMSAGDGHRRPNKCSALKVHELLGSGGAPELMRRWRGLSDAYDIPDLARRRPWRARGCHLLRARAGASSVLIATLPRPARMPGSYLRSQLGEDWLWVRSAKPRHSDCIS